MSLGEGPRTNFRPALEAPRRMVLNTTEAGESKEPSDGVFSSARHNEESLERQAAIERLVSKAFKGISSVAQGTI